MNQFKNIWQKFAGKGYYIALILCALVIGIAGYLYCLNNDQPEPQLQIEPTGDADIPVIATEPTQPAPGSTPLETATPLQGQTIHEYAMDCLTYDPTTRDWRVHNGIDIASEAGTPVKAAAEGVVTQSYQDDRMGTTVVIRHEGGYVTTYSSLDPEVAVRPGEEVAMGQTIGSVGQSALLESALGDHVHFCVTLDGQPMNPAAFLPDLE